MAKNNNNQSIEKTLWAVADKLQRQIQYTQKPDVEIKAQLAKIGIKL